MSQRDDYRAVRLESIFQAAVSDFALPDVATTSTSVARASSVVASSDSEGQTSAVSLNTLAVSAADTQAPAALRPYEPIAMDGVIAGWEANNRVHLRGQAVGEAGSTVTLTFNDQSWQSTVNKWGYWNASMPAEALKGLPDGNYSLKLTITDKAGNSTESTVDFGLYVDKTIKPTVTVDTISGDDAVSITEGVYGVDITGSATHMATNSIIKLTLGGKTVTGAVDSNGQWIGHFSSGDLQALQDGVYSLKVTAVDANGKSSTVTHDLTLLTHLSSVPKIHFDKVTDDNVINLAESKQDLLISGTLSTVAAGQALVLKGGDGVEHHATIGADGHWQVLIAAADVDKFISSGEVRVYAVDAANNYTDDILNLNIHTILTPIYYEMNIGGDMTLNYEEAQHGLTFYIEGVKELEINGKTYLPEQGMITLPKDDLMALLDGDVTATAHRWDDYGNSDTQTLDHFFKVAVHDLPTLTLNTPFDDNVIDAADVNTWHLIQGSSSHLDQGSIVTVTLGDQSYSAAVKADGNWALTILAGQLAPLDEGQYEMKVTAKDSAGNVASASQNVTVDTHDASATTLSTLKMDDVIDAFGTSAAVTSTAATSTAEPATAAASHTAIDSNLVADSPYTLADHLWQHSAAQIMA